VAAKIQRPPNPTIFYRKLVKIGQNQSKPTGYKKLGPTGYVGFQKKTPVLLTLAAATTPLTARPPRPHPHPVNNVVTWCFTSPTVPCLY
jgi:hypothetical protein